jgi:hypothetical protein
MTASEYLQWAALLAPSPGADGRVRGAGVAPACLLDIGHIVQVVDVANVLPPAAALVRQRVVRLVSCPALTVAH